MNKLRVFTAGGMFITLAILGIILGWTSPNHDGFITFCFGFITFGQFDLFLRELFK